MAPSKAGVSARTFAFLTFIHVLDGFTSSIKEGTMKRKTKRKRYTEPPCDDERIKFEKAFQEYLGQLSATFDGDGNLRDDARRAARPGNRSLDPNRRRAPWFVAT
jgi:hypothetical protein